MKRFRKLTVLIALTFVVGIPGAALAKDGTSNCVGESVQRLHSTFMGLAHTEQGAVGDMIAWIRANPDDLPWCE